MNSSPVINTKRTSGHAALDNTPSTSIESSSQGTSPFFKGRPITPLPKRAKRQFMVSLDDEPWTSIRKTLMDTFFSDQSSCVPKLSSSGPTTQTWPDTVTTGSNSLLLASDQVATTSPSVIVNRTTPKTFTQIPLSFSLTDVRPFTSTIRPANPFSLRNRALRSSPRSYTHIRR
jgi:hypothetical protein